MTTRSCFRAATLITVCAASLPFTGRAGYTWGPGLLYVKGGYAYADTRNTGLGPFLFDDRRDGYTVGGGIEYVRAKLVR
jgi:opacity protein-like surface antigen